MQSGPKTFRQYQLIRRSLVSAKITHCTIECAVLTYCHVLTMLSKYLFLLLLCQVNIINSLSVSEDFVRIQECMHMKYRHSTDCKTRDWYAGAGLEGCKIRTYCNKSTTNSCMTMPARSYTIRPLCNSNLSCSVNVQRNSND